MCGMRLLEDAQRPIDGCCKNTIQLGDGGNLRGSFWTFAWQAIKPLPQLQQ
jgi:hypothetical protein